MAKKNKTIKELNLDFELLSERVNRLEEDKNEKRNTSECERKIERIGVVLKKYDEQIDHLKILLEEGNAVKNVTADKKNEPEVQSFKCKVCAEMFDCTINLKKHIQKNHAKVYRCKRCENSFVKSSDLEMHIKSIHIDTTQYKCKECDKTFVLEWRLKKHTVIHEDNDNTKCCHYFNNKKECPYENLGCMFMHKLSRECKYGRKCTSKLCQFQHNNVKEILREKETSEGGEFNQCDSCDYVARNGEELLKHIKKDHEYQKYDTMDECDKYEVNEYICSNLCWQGDHKCYDKDEENELLGVDVKKIKEDYRNCVEEDSFKCEACKFESSSLKKVKEHFLIAHRNSYKLGCWKCEKKFTTILELRKHVGTYHYTPISESENQSL